MCVDVLSFSNLSFIELLGFVDSYLSSKLGSICHYFFKYSFCPFLFLSPSLSLYPGTQLHMLLCLVVSHRSLMLCSFFPPFFFFIFRLDNLNWSVFKSTDSFSLPACLLLISSSELSFQLLYCVFQLQNFHLGLFSWNLSLHWYFLLVRNYSHDFLYCFRNGLF